MRLLRQVYGTEISLAGEERALVILRELSGLSQKGAKRLHARISRARSLLEEPEGDDAALLEGYRRRLRAEGLFDFDDLIEEPLRLLRSGLLKDAPFHHFLVDEYQDVSPAQYAFLRALAGEGGAICAVGDSDQAIYGFRGADMTGFLDFQREFPSSAAVLLEESYRSTATILAAASSVIGRNVRRISKGLTPSRSAGVPVRLISVADERAEALYVAAEIEARMGAMTHLQLSRAKGSLGRGGGACRFGDFAVLFRTNAQATVFARTLGEAGIPCQAPFDGRSRWDEMVASFRSSALESGRGLPAGELLHQAWKASGCDEEWIYLEVIARSYEHLPAAEAVEGIAAELALMGPADRFGGTGDRVSLMTFHMAKGLEFRVLFLAGIREGLVPLLRHGGEDESEEERRLFYVAMTRARDELFILSPGAQTFYGRRQESGPSPFVAEIPGNLTERVEVAPRERKKKRPVQSGLF
jgi:superfamily I DNA/RNA helicase